MLSVSSFSQDISRNIRLILTRPCALDSGVFSATLPACDLKDKSLRAADCSVPRAVVSIALRQVCPAKSIHHLDSGGITR